MAHIGIKFVEDRDDVSNDGCISSSRVWGFSTFTPMFSHKIIWTARNRTGKQLEGAEVSDGVSPADWGLAIQLIFITFRLIHSFLGWGRALTLQALVTDPTQTPSWHRRLYIISQKGIYPVNASGCQTGNRVDRWIRADSRLLRMNSGPKDPWNHGPLKFRRKRDVVSGLDPTLISILILRVIKKSDTMKTATC